MSGAVQMGLLAGPELKLEHNGDKRLVKDSQLQAMENWIATAPELVLDYETDGLLAHKGRRPFCANLFSPDKGPKVADYRITPRAKEALKNGLKRREREAPAGGVIIAHNATFEVSHTTHDLGIDLPGQLWDNQAAAFALNEQRTAHGTAAKNRASQGFSQKSLVVEELKRQPTYAIAIGEWFSNAGVSPEQDGAYAKLPMDLLVPYGCEDVTDAWDLYKHFRPQCVNKGYEELVKTDSELSRSLSDMQTTGLHLDMARVEELIKDFGQKRAGHYGEIKRLVGRDIDVNSHQTLFGLLYGERKIPLHPDLEKTGKLDDGVLEWMLTLEQVSNTPTAELIGHLRDWREYEKFLGTYLMPWAYEWARDGVLHPNLHHLRVGTRRFSSSDPNLQNIPNRSELAKLLRECFLSRDGYVTYSMDESQAEYRVFTHYSKDPNLLRGYRTDPAFDIHEAVSQMLGVARKVGKNLNFGILYGMGMDKLARSLLTTKEKAKAILDAYFAKIPGYKRLKHELEQMVRRFGYIKDVFGGTRHMTVAESYKGINTICQMTVADLFRKAMVRMRPIIKRAGGDMLLQIHDEQLFQLPGRDPRDHVSTLRELAEALTDFKELTVPLRTDCEWFTTNWSNAQPFALA